jgi:dTDP-N-acetylfucosamine:lipid II N-acetylfucosaminyltransferase
MILHIHSYPSHFIKLAIDCFTISELNSYHIVIGKVDKPENIPAGVLYLKERSKEYFDFFKNDLGNYKLALFHCLFNSNLVAVADVLKLKNKELKTAWVIYGAEIQESYLIPSMFLGKTTAFQYYKLLPYRIFVPFYRLYLKLIGKNVKLYLKEIDYFAHFISEEADYVFEHTGVKKPLLFHSYAILESYIEPSIANDKVVKNGNILIGNSATFTCNHYEIFEHLQNFNFNDSKVIVPLSYGNMVYKDFVIKSGKKLLKDSFEPITEFLQKEKYHELQLSCSVMILNHYRQQALANIVSAAWMGMRIYINKQTTSYQFFKRKGLIIFSIEDDLKNENEKVFDSLNDIEIEHNRTVLKSIFGKNNAVKSFRDSFVQFT